MWVAMNGTRRSGVATRPRQRRENQAVTFQDALDELVRFDGTHVGVDVLAPGTGPGKQPSVWVSASGWLHATGQEKPRFLLTENETLEADLPPGALWFDESAFVDAESNPSKDTVTIHFEHFEVVVQKMSGLGEFRYRRV